MKHSFIYFLSQLAVLTLFFSCQKAPELIPVSSIELDKNALTLIKGETATLIAMVEPDYATNITVTWASSDKAITTVDANGKVTAVSKGSATIKVTANDGSGVSASCAVSVKEPKLYTAVAGEAVDLGLSVKWSSMNLGATTPTGYGDYFAWGETAPKDKYSWGTYEWCNGSSSTLTRYNISSDYGNVDNKAGFEDYNYVNDAARQALGGKWRIPTNWEWEELARGCKWTWTEDYNNTGIAGCIVKGSTGKSIFLPAAGYIDDTELLKVGIGHYWSSWLFTANSDYAKGVNVLHGYGGNVFERYNGISVRPVSE